MNGCVVGRECFKPMFTLTQANLPPEEISSCTILSTQDFNEAGVILVEFIFSAVTRHLFVSVSLLQLFRHF